MSLETRLLAFIQAVGLDVKNILLALAGKQATLVSGTSIKTVNGQTLLGSGNLSVGGGGGGAITQVDLNVLGVANGYAELIVADANVSATSKVVAHLVGELDAENDAEEMADSDMRIFAIAEAGQIRFVLTGLGNFAGLFKVNYEVGT